MAGDMRVATTGRDLAVGQYLWVASAERSFLIQSIRAAPWPGASLVTLATGISEWTIPCDHDEECALEVLS